MVKIIKTDSYFNVFPLLTDSLKGASKEIGKKNLIFCEEKISLMAERWVTESLGGTFNTEVYSFGSFLLKNKTFNSLLSREGSSMVIKKILLEAPLSCFNKSKATMSSALYDLLILLKSASVTPKDLLNAGESIEGILKNKLTDIHTIFSAYQEYLIENGLEDQSGQLDYLPEVIENYNGIEKANVYVIGYNGFTAQIRKVIKTLINKASSFTAILPYGENEFAFVNETALAIKKISQEANQKVVEQFIVTKREKEAEHIVKTIFSPDFITKTPIETQKIHASTAKSESEEFEKIACVIEQKVRSEGLKYKNFSVILPDVSGKDELIKAFNLIGVPYFIDDKVTVMNHPLITLLLSYLEIFRKNFNRKDYLSFVKNPLITQDKSLSDRYENYIYKYDLDYSAFKKPFTKDDLETEEMERLRLRVNSYLDYFSPVKLFEKIGALQTLNFLSEKLKEKARSEEVSINEQIYDYVTRIINEIKSILGEDKITLIEYKNLLISGLSAIKLSIIPQYNDAVFVGGFKEVGLYQTPAVQPDPNICIACGTCALTCPDSAIRVERK